jgi:hypothetical protein
MARFKVTVTPSIADVVADIHADIEKVAMATMAEVSTGLKTALREQVVAAGLGGRLANTWRGKVYPDKGRQSVNPATLVYSKAPNIVDAFSRAPLIVPVNGTRYLAIPTENVPHKGRGKIMTPVEVEAAFNQDLKFATTKDGKLFAFVEAVQSAGGTSWRRPTKGRMKQGRKVKAVIMFFLIPHAQMPKLFDLEAAAAEWTAQAQNLLGRNLNNL